MFASPLLFFWEYPVIAPVLFVLVTVVGPVFVLYLAWQVLRLLVRLNVYMQLLIDKEQANREL